MDKYYPVKTGDTPNAIAEEVGLDVEDLLELKHEGGVSNRELIASHLNLVAGADGKATDERNRIIPQIGADGINPKTELVEGLALLLGDPEHHAAKRAAAAAELEAFRASKRSGDAAQAEKDAEELEAYRKAAGEGKGQNPPAGA